MTDLNRPLRASRFSAVRASFLSAVVARIEAKGLRAQPLLNRIGLAPQHLSDPYDPIPLAQFVTFLEGAADAVGDPYLGARIGQEIKAGDMGPVGIVLSLSESIGAGLDRVARYASGLQSGTVSRWDTADGVRVFSYRLADETIWPRRQDAEFSLVSLTQVLRDSFLRNLSPVEVHFEHVAPADLAPIRRFFRCPLQFQQPTNRLFLRDEDCGRLLRKEDGDLIATLERHIGDIVGAMLPNPDLVTAVRAMIETQLGLSALTLDRIAAGLRMTPRSLQRRLAEEGTSLRNLLENVRRQSAMRMLAQPGVKVAHVAQALGYREATAFWRAYRGWTGEPPSHRLASRRSGRAAPDE